VPPRPEPPAWRRFATSRKIDRWGFRGVGGIGPTIVAVSAARMTRLSCAMALEPVSFR
jgi:hypothetical protein